MTDEQPAKFIAGRGKIEGTEYADIVRRLIAAHWTAPTISLYLKGRFGVDVSEHGIRAYKARHREEIMAEYPDIEASGMIAAGLKRATDLDDFVDVVGTLGRMVRLQETRVWREFELEQQFPKGFDSTRQEIKVLSELLGQYHETMQDYGVTPKAEVNVNVRSQVAFRAEAAVPLLDMMEQAEDREKVIEFARFVNENTRALTAGNGDEPLAAG